MDSIPNEILSEIFGALADIASPRCIISAASFSECTYSVRNAHAIMLGTSSRWRALSLSNSRLWTTIPITTRCNQTYIDTMLKRCGVHPLTILYRMDSKATGFMLGAFLGRLVSLWLSGKPTYNAGDLSDMRIRELRIDSSSVNFYFERSLVLQHFRLLEGLRVHSDTVQHPRILAGELCNLRTLALRSTLPLSVLELHGEGLETLILHGIYQLSYTATLSLSRGFIVLPLLTSIVISPPELDVEELPVFDSLEAMTLPSLQSLDLHTLQEWPTASTSAFFARSACRLTTLHLCLPRVTPHVLSVLMQCDETLVDVSLIGLRGRHHDLPRTILEYIAGEPSSAGTHQHLPHLMRLALQTSSAQIELLWRMFFMRVIKWREMGVAMLESCSLFVNEENDYRIHVWDGIRSVEDAGCVIQINSDL
ncbi:hypothetical protein BDZ89DRAFT_1062793 [Hymenopellis radicata]|nr:hypothetical protein BDZ89DRAFT_1062793 [Hymenopellis radicata]